MFNFFLNTGKFCDQCKDGFYGNDCNDPCDSYCLTCSKVNGSCLLFNDTSYLTNITTDFLSDFTETTLNFKNFTNLLNMTWNDTEKNLTDTFSKSNMTISMVNCSIGHWSNQSYCQICGLCKDGLCNSNNGTCENDMCINEKLEKPYCNKCKETFSKLPNCTTSSIIIIRKKTPTNINSSNIITSWLVTLSFIVFIKFLLNNIYSKNENNDKDFLYDLEYEKTLNTKLNLTSDDLNGF